MAALSVEVACRALLRRGARLLPQRTERRYHKCPASQCLHKIRSPGIKQLFVVTSVRHQSTVTGAADEAQVLPEIQLQPSAAFDNVLPPPLAESAPTVSEAILPEAVHLSLSDLGLGGYTPVGLIQNFLEFLNVDVGLPWWGAIVTGTVLARILVFPLIVKGQREAAKLNNHMPQISSITNRINEAKQSGNKFQFPSMQSGGLWWFTDLTAADPFYILPLTVTCTMWGVLELGAESGVDNPNLKIMKTVFRVMPLIILPLTINFPTAVFTYWVASNVFSLAQVGFLKIPAVRKKLKIPERIIHEPSALPAQESFITNLKKGPLRQTFSHNPLQQKKSNPVSPSKPKSKP
ncbi:hypothetical protein XELAEV_18010246mg [Xenopus laevis]|uniref:Mitochondrial inner membrane protein OXA1L n=1 Tax=Xenopus laevis TaxID=8355 RepID=A0A974DU60_XENLA|nr:hypothetical protein XELAEV_18010246mg [Xenopus laevis]